MAGKKKEKINKTEISNTEVKEKKKRNIKANKRRGSDYERKIAKELREIGYESVVTSRSESKSIDDAKVDLIDKSNELPCHFQLKRTMKYPNYLAIDKECSLKDKPLVLLWDVQRATESTFRSDGELVIMKKEFFYELLQIYRNYKLISE